MKSNASDIVFFYHTRYDEIPKHAYIASRKNGTWINEIKETSNFLNFKTFYSILISFETDEIKVIYYIKIDYNLLM